MRRRHLIIALAVLLALACVTTVLWKALDWPPPRLILKYGLPPAGGPTGRTKTIRGVEFAEVAPGYCKIERNVWMSRGDWLGRLSGSLGLSWGKAPQPAEAYVDEWVELPTAILICGEPRIIPSTPRTRARRHSSPEVRWAEAKEIYFAIGTGALSVREFAVLRRARTPELGLLIGPGWGEKEWTWKEAWDRAGKERSLLALTARKEASERVWTPRNDWPVVWIPPGLRD